MLAILDDKEQYLHMKYDSPLEEQQVNVSFTRKIEGWKFKRGKNSYWNGDVGFVKNGSKLPVGLWNELKIMCERFKFPLKLMGFSNMIEENTVPLEFVQEYAQKLFETHEYSPYDEQIMGVFKALKYKKCVVNCSQSLGKTLMMYLLIMMLWKKGLLKKALIVTIDPGLVIQTYNEFIKFCDGRFDMKLGMIHGGSKIDDLSNYKMVIGNFQTLVNLDRNFFNEFSVVIFDEGHRADNNSNKLINESCINARYKIALTGSFKDNHHADYYNVLSYFGPIVYKVSKRQAIDKGIATELKITIITLNYAPREQRIELSRLRDRQEDYEKVFRLEQNYVRESEIRLKYICHFSSRLTGNQIIFFLDKKNKYGHKIVDGIRRLNPEKEIYYIDGDVDKKLREMYQERMEQGSNKILVASYDTFSTGKSIKNIHHLLLAESRKAFEVISQLLGRGMRLHESKDECNVYDFVDDFSLHESGYQYTGYMIKHKNERIGIYKDEELVYTQKTIDLRNVTLTW